MRLSFFALNRKFAFVKHINIVRKSEIASCPITTAEIDSSDHGTVNVAIDAPKTQPTVINKQKAMTALSISKAFMPKIMSKESIRNSKEDKQQSV